MKQGDIYIVSLDPTLGHEQQGSRPVVVVSAEAFNKRTKLPVVCPLTTGGKFARSIGFAVPVEFRGTPGVVRCDQPRVLDLVARKASKAGHLPPEISDDIVARVTALFERDPHSTKRAG